ncbi:MAG: tRNA 4-thiouridine(8) synthase ThiI [Myxococcales bacterium]|nr:tRNA 4-thiouridine(8) synthase ThiI [Myxococcales bacterium]MDH5306693.1 tRNA 4-thiouridine(8) synthase ThiI [Myxococcales bacterium]MDH5565782.1 tRNA 4-thiouridine(8) synthase ThiI [Myxococcales bacterium]
MGDEQHTRLALLRFSGEIGTKARATRLQFRQRLVQNLRDALASHGLSARLEVSHERIFVELPQHGPDPTDSDALRDHPLARIFGIQSLSCVERRPITSLDAIVSSGVALFGDRVRAKRFAVRARRVGNRGVGALRSREVQVALGAALLPRSAGVDLSAPDVTVHIELAEHGTSFFSERIGGPGGLPLGVEGAAVALLSGGFDSAVAAWQMLKRGVALDYVFCNLGGPLHLHGTIRVAKVLADRWSYGDRPQLHAIDFEPVAEALRASTQKRYWQILLKRLMLRAAAAVGRRGRAAAIVTGEAVGQVSSQTLQNLTVISRATDETILRPLIGFNKEDIIAAAGRIGTFELSKVIREYCALVSRRPATRAGLGVVEREEAKLDPAVLERAIDSRSVVDLRELALESLERPEISVERLPEKAVLIDLRPLEQYRSGHHPDALHLDFARALEAFPEFERGHTYVLSCEFGWLSAHLAQRMRRAGFDAYHFRGGQRALMRAAP